MGVAQVMAADIPDPCLDPNRAPVTLKITCRLLRGDGNTHEPALGKASRNQRAADGCQIVGCRVSPHGSRTIGGCGSPTCGIR